MRKGCTMKIVNCMFAIMAFVVMTTTDLFGQLDFTRTIITVGAAAVGGSDFVQVQGNARAFRIKPKPCWDKKGTEGTCMFQWECHRRQGVMLSTCIDKFLFGTCCYISNDTRINSTVLSTVLPSSSVSVTTENVNDDDNSNFVFTQVAEQPATSTMPPAPFPTPNINQIFHHFLGSYLANYSDKVDFTSTTAAIVTTLNDDNETVSTTAPSPPPPTTTITSQPDIFNVSYDSADYQYDLLDETTTQNELTSSTVSQQFLDSTTTLSVNVVETIIPSTTVITTEKTTTTPSTTTSTSSTTKTTSPTTPTTVTTSNINKVDVDLNNYDGDSDDMYSDINDYPSQVSTTAESTRPTTTKRPFDYKTVSPRFFLASYPSNWILSLLFTTLLPSVLSWFVNSAAICNLPLVSCDRFSSDEQIIDDQPLFQFQANEAVDCGVRPLLPNGRIVGGTASRFGEWPWQVLIKEATWLGLFVKNKCGGVLLNKRYVITAAHCQPSFLASLLVVFGESDLSVNNEELKSFQRNVRRVIVHRKFNSLTFDNDLALLELDRPVEYKPNIVPICLPEDDIDLTDQVAIVSGWGRLKFGGRLPTGLQHVEVPIIPNRKCQQMFLSAGHIKGLGDKFICAGYKDGGKDSCEGDSGGPLMMEGNDGRWILIGTVSHGIKCAYPNLPGVYINIAAYKSWILKVINS